MDSSHKKQVIRKSFLFYDIFIRFANGRWQFILKRSKYRRGYSINVKWYLNISLCDLPRSALISKWQQATFWLAYTNKMCFDLSWYFSLHSHPKTEAVEESRTMPGKMRSINGHLEKLWLKTHTFGVLILFVDSIFTFIEWKGEEFVMMHQATVNIPFMYQFSLVTHFEIRWLNIIIGCVQMSLYNRQ